MKSHSLTRFAWVSIGAAIATMALKAFSYIITGSVGFLSDAAESLVNLAGGVMALAMLSIAARPADDHHAYGHSKAEYFASTVEGLLILVAAAGIGSAAVHRLLSPQPLEQVRMGIAVSAVAAIVNLGAGWLLLRAGRRHGSVTLEANARHLFTDVWTSAGVIVGVAAVTLTGWQRLDPVIALAVAVNIVWTGARILQGSVLGFMDTALPEEEQAAIRGVLDSYAGQGIHYHALRTRRAGQRRFVSVHVLVPGEWTVQRGHQLTEQIENDLRAALPNVAPLTHLESLNDPASWRDISIDRS
ncbi:MAG: cation diffusion facilitator family transporter [Candidatus Krumholzibacteria bacterium]|nr:cation diffusion facilitator family transporter [Candidatus Krumholzibacteria bacterium]MDH4337816.1 cation diffusion facilitator family transporter [Candidatus Krumholzibacteria bacterium]